MFPIYFYDSYEQFGFYGLSLFLHQLINAIMAETGYSEFLNALHIAQVGFEAILTAANNAGFDAFFEFYKGPDNAANVIWNEHYLIKRRRYFAQLFDPSPVISLAETALTAWMLACTPARIKCGLCKRINADSVGGGAQIDAIITFSIRKKRDCRRNYQDKSEKESKNPLHSGNLLFSNL